MEKRITTLALVLAMPYLCWAAGAEVWNKRQVELGQPLDQYKVLMLVIGLVTLFAWGAYILIVLRMKTKPATEKTTKRNIQAMPHYSATESYRPSALSSHLMAVKATRGSKPSDSRASSNQSSRGTSE
jgi:hypothetical protein